MARAVLDRPPPLQGWRTTDEDEIALRRWRGRTEIVAIEALEPDQPFFGTFRVQSGSGGFYEVEIRGLDGFGNSCGCIDHRANGLGTCKHIEGVLAALRQRNAKAFREAAARGTPRIEVFLDRRGAAAPALIWPAGDRRRASAASRWLAAFVEPDGTLALRSEQDRGACFRLARRACRHPPADSAVAPFHAVARSATPAALARRRACGVPRRGQRRHCESRSAAPPAAALSARRHAASRIRRAGVARRRDGPRQDRPGDRGLRAAGPPQGHRARAGRLPGLAQGGMGGADRALHRPRGAFRVRAPAGAPCRLPRARHSSPS